ncbi:sulfite exporter TauE/SafE family protein [Alphaproteobacteria bacterium]|nr:sulfite exporter TauE/SafE family protein [Alphaproteobacteria bacterium]MDC0969539.1 sulfite exporter TauE/SafE family protein [Alphaproteobacteria bacterium]MDC6451945.1 sulfite exporter TauE/SafE family protein [Alphaproteobacteria bacterium]
MINDILYQELLVYFIGLLITGVIGGLIAGLFGVGGGIVIVPILFWIFTSLNFPNEILMHMAIGSSLATIIPTSISSARAHYHRGSIEIDIIKKWAPGIFLGAIIGGLSGKYFSVNELKYLFASIAFLVALNMFFKEPLRLGNNFPKSRLLNIIMSSLIGLVSSLMGVGAGTLGVPALVALSVPIHKAIGTAAALGLFIAVPATLGLAFSGFNIPNRPPMSIGYVNLIAFFIMFPLTVFFAPVGVKLAHRINQRALKSIFGIFLIITSIKMLSSIIF